MIVFRLNEIHRFSATSRKQFKGLNTDNNLLPSCLVSCNNLLVSSFYILVNKLRIRIYIVRHFDTFIPYRMILDWTTTEKPFFFCARLQIDFTGFCQLTENDLNSFFKVFWNSQSHCDCDAIIFSVQLMDHVRCNFDNSFIRCYFFHLWSYSYIFFIMVVSMTNRPESVQSSWLSVH